MKNPMVNQLHNEETREELALWNKVYNQYCTENGGTTFYVVHGEHIGNYVAEKDFYYPMARKLCETAHVSKIMEKEIDRWERNKLSDASVHLTMNVCRNVIVVPANKASKELRKWFREYYFPDDFYENLAVERDHATGTYYIWNREEETRVAEYITPENGEETNMIIFYKNLKN